MRANYTNIESSFTIIQTNCTNIETDFTNMQADCNKKRYDKICHIWELLVEKRNVMQKWIEAKCFWERKEDGIEE